jgi:hypothetical protein
MQRIGLGIIDERTAAISLEKEQAGEEKASDKFGDRERIMDGKDLLTVMSTLCNSLPLVLSAYQMHCPPQ